MIKFSKPYPWEGVNKILVTTHAFVDPDALGSLLPMGSFLKSLGKQVTLVAVGGVPQNLQFLVGDLKVKSELNDDINNFELVVVLDCGNISLPRIPALEETTVPILNIDHHQDNKNFGAYNYVDKNSAATAEIVFHLLKDAGFKIGSFEATALLAGLMGDTGAFRHSNTNASVFWTAGELLLAGARLTEVVKNIFSGRSPDQLKAWAYVLEQAEYDATSGAIISALTQEDIENLDVSDDAFSGIVEILNTFPKAKYAALVRQMGGEVKFSLRSEEYKAVDVSQIAARFGGGGHKLAAGFTIAGRLRRENGNVYIEPTISK